MTDLDPKADFLRPIRVWGFPNQEQNGRPVNDFERLMYKLCVLEQKIDRLGILSHGPTWEQAAESIRISHS